MQVPTFLDPRCLVPLLAGVVMTACGGPTGEVGKVEPVEIEDVDELFEAVDTQLDCPPETSMTYGFDVGDDEVLPGRTCAESVVMVYSDDEETIAEIQERMLTTQDGALPMAHGTTWLVADITEITEESGDLQDPDSRDLEALAEVLGGRYSVF